MGIGAVITFAILCLAGICAVYLYALVLFGAKTVKNVSSGVYNKFAILIPAHNEAHNIKQLIGSLMKSHYPRDHYDCYCVADHCSDATAVIASDSGVKCYQKNDGEPGKGKALSWIIDRIFTENEKKYDAFVFFDADNIIDPGFLTVMNDSLNNGNEIIQGCPDIANWESSGFSMVNYVNYVTINRLRENAKSNIGLSARLRGHGMCFKSDVLKQYKFSSESCVEDQDLYMQVILSSRRVVWEQEAKVFSMLPESVHKAAKQRVRWSMAKHLHKDRFIVELFGKMLKKPDPVLIDAFIETIMPSNSILVGTSFLAFMLSLFFRNNHPWMMWCALIILVSYMIYFLIGARMEKLPAKCLVLFAVSPIFIFWRIWVYILSFTKTGKQSWN